MTTQLETIRSVQHAAGWCLHIPQPNLKASVFALSPSFSELHSHTYPVLSRLLERPLFSTNTDTIILQLKKDEASMTTLLKKITSARVP